MKIKPYLNDIGDYCTHCGSKNVIIPTVPEHRLGYVRGNETIEISDALEVLKYIVGLESVIANCENAFNAARITGGDMPTIKDVLEILKYIVGIDGKGSENL